MTKEKFYKEYYGSPVIRNLVKDQFKDAAFAVGSGPFLKEQKWDFPVRIAGVSDLDSFMDQGLDIYRPARSTGDAFYIFWDLEYYNKKQRSYVYRHQKKVFEWMEPFIKQINARLNAYGINYIIDTTASGYHYWMKISKKSAVFRMLAEEGFSSESLRKKYARVSPRDIKRVMPVHCSEGRAYDCAGKLLEYISQRIRREMAKGAAKLDITISDSPIPGSGRHEGFSSDITQYAHPLYMRVFRVMASLHQKNILYYGGKTPAVDIVRRKGMSVDKVLECMWSAGKAVGLFHNFYPELNYSNDGFAKLFSEYKKSEVRALHREFELARPEELNIEDEPEKIKKSFTAAHANPALLEPSVLQQMINHYSAESPERLKGALEIIARYYNDPSYLWYNSSRFTGIDWKKYDASQSAHFWGRIYFTQYKLDNGGTALIRRIKNG
ncbi:hypothetical protein KJ633_03335 [bacterium]|nr:hypothetical protein [bacterium]MBU3955470.1 hypothetical protein [bacterium]MBU4133800.1 hypothetical protein [bacterium]